MATVCVTRWPRSAIGGHAILIPIHSCGPRLDGRTDGRTNTYVVLPSPVIGRPLARTDGPSPRTQSNPKGKGKERKSMRARHGRRPHHTLPIVVGVGRCTR